jgi:hypothetical protein
MFDAPRTYDQLTDDEKRNAIKKEDICVIGEDHFVRGVIQFDIIGVQSLRPVLLRTWGIGAWVSLKKENYERYLELFREKNVSGNGPYFGWLSNSLAGYPETWSLKTRLHLRPYPERPLIELEPTDHPLAVQQREGIHMREVQALVERVLHSIN